MTEIRVERKGLSLAAVADLERRVEQLNRRARKLGVPELRVELGDVRVVPLPAPGEPVRHREVRDAVVVGEGPRQAGWALVAVLDHDGPETVTHRVPGADADLSAYRDARAYCAHCAVTRRRLDTFVVQNETGTLSQVGRNCLEDFLGGQSPAAILWLAGWVREVGSFDEDPERGSGETVVAAQDFLSAASACIRKDGWLSRTKARETDGRATADDAWDLLTIRSPSESWRRWADERTATDQDAALATAALAWARDLDPADQNEYLSNLGRVARKDWMKARDVGLLASAVATYAREQLRERERAADPVSAHFGEVKTRYRGLVVSVLGRSYHERNWGGTTLLRMSDADGRRFKWWASNGAEDMEDGGTYTVDATVKSHDVWKGRLETTLTRVKAAR